MKRDVAAKALTVPGLRRLLASAVPNDGVLVLNYHRVGDSRASRYDRALWSATAEAFDAQMAFLKANCDLLALDEVEDALERRRGRHVAITFDDGYLDNHAIAFPVLRHHRVPAAFFIATGFVDHKLLPWWDAIAMQVRETASASLDLRPWAPAPIATGPDREAAIRSVLAVYKQLAHEQTGVFRERIAEETGIEAPASVDGEWMDWDMIREMAAAGMTIGGHTVTHPVLSRLPAELQRHEIEGCARRLREELGTAMEYFAYPVGGRGAFNQDTWRLLQAAGVRHAYSFYGGLARASSARLDLQRVAIDQSIGTDLFRAMVQLPRAFCEPAVA